MHRPELAAAWSALGLVLRFNSSFPPRLREFVILLVGGLSDGTTTPIVGHRAGRKTGQGPFLGAKKDNHGSLRLRST
jgi:hypothetical protein